MREEKVHFLSNEYIKIEGEIDRYIGVDGELYGY